MIHFVSACLPKADNIRTSGLFYALDATFGVFVHLMDRLCNFVENRDNENEIFILLADGGVVFSGGGMRGTFDG